jgi:hypothetical protein
MWYTSVGFPLFEKQKPCERLERKTCLLTQELRKVHTNNYDNQNNVKSRKTFQMSEKRAYFSPYPPRDSKKQHPCKRQDQNP